MIINYSLDKSFGPIGSVAGITIFIAGLVLVFFSISGLFLILFGAFVGFSSTSTFIDFERKRVRFSNNLFGIIRAGRWFDITSDMKVGIKNSTKTWRAYSRGSQTLDATIKDFRIILYDSANNQIMPLRKLATIESAKIEVEKLSNQLELGLMP